MMICVLIKLCEEDEEGEGEGDILCLCVVQTLVSLLVSVGGLAWRLGCYNAVSLYSKSLSRREGAKVRVMYCIYTNWSTHDDLAISV